MRLDQAGRIMLGDREVSRVYLGANLVWRNAFSPASLFAQGEPGVWYDPSDFSTMFQDAAGATPVTAVEQPVGRILDKSGRGNHATQVTATSRPVLSARVNVLQKTDSISDSYWIKTGSTTSGFAFYETSETGLHGVRKLNPGNQAIAGTLSTLSAKIKANGRNYVLLYDNQGRYFDITPGTSGAVLGGYDANVPQASIKPLGDDWFLCQITYPCPSTWHPQIFVSDTGTRASYAGDVTKGIYVTDIDLRPANQASLPYQRVNTATDYDADPAKFPYYLYFDGVDDFLVTPTITPNTDKAQVFAGVRKLRDAAYQAITELSANPDATNQSFTFGASTVTGDASRRTWAFGSKGTASLALASGAVYKAPITNVLAGIGNISGDSVILRVNGTQAASHTSDQGTGNYGNHPLYIGRRGGAASPFSGHLYSLIVRFGSNLTIETIEQAETWINGKTGAY